VLNRPVEIAILPSQFPINQKDGAFLFDRIANEYIVFVQIGDASGMSQTRCFTLG